jgi:hypothetical protein
MRVIHPSPFARRLQKKERSFLSSVAVRRRRTGWSPGAITVALRATATEEGAFFPLFCSRSTKANGIWGHESDPSVALRATATEEKTDGYRRESTVHRPLFTNFVQKFFSAPNPYHNSIDPSRKGLMAYSLARHSRNQKPESNLELRDSGQEIPHPFLIS